MLNSYKALSIFLFLWVKGRLVRYLSVQYCPAHYTVGDRWGGDKLMRRVVGIRALPARSCVEVFFWVAQARTVVLSSYQTWPPPPSPASKSSALRPWKAASLFFLAEEKRMKRMRGLVRGLRTISSTHTPTPFRESVAEWADYYGRLIVQWDSKDYRLLWGTNTCSSLRRQGLLNISYIGMKYRSWLRRNGHIGQSLYPVIERTFHVKRTHDCENVKETIKKLPTGACRSWLSELTEYADCLDW